MTTTLLYTLSEKVIAYARRTQQIFVAHCVWWLASIIGLEQGLINHLDNIQSRVEVATAAEVLSEDITSAVKDTRKQRKEVPGSRKVSPTPRDVQDDLRIDCETDNVHPDRRDQVGITNLDISDLDLNDIPRVPRLGVVESTEEFLKESRKEWKAFLRRQRTVQLPRTRSGKIVKPVTPGERKYLQCIPKESIKEYLENRK
jgi:hypothetical protein